MIKINLANTMMKGAESGGFKLMPSTNAKESVDLLVKVVLIILPVVIILFYEKNQLSSKVVQLDEINVQKNNLSQELAKVGSVDDMNRQMDAQKKELEDKVQVMKKIFSLRESKLKTLLAVQNHIPRSSWIDKITFDQRDVTVQGLASTTEEAQSYASLLSQEKILFEEFHNKGVSSVKKDVAGKEGASSEFFQFEYTMRLKE